jgi:hypothetical protein
MRNSGGSAVLSLDLPKAGRPKAVQKALDEFDRVATEVARLQGEKRESREVLERAKKEDRADYAARLAKDFDAEPRTDAEDAVKEQVARIEQRLPILDGLADTAGNTLVRTVGQALDEGWRDELQTARDEAAAQVQAKIEELGAALEEYGRAKGAASWAAAFTVKDALTPDWHRAANTRYRPNAPLVVPMPSNANAPRLNGTPQVAATQVIAGLRQVTAEPEPRRTVEVAIVGPNRG